MQYDFSSFESRKGDIAVVTGANSGVGFEVSIGLAKKDIKVVMACRNIQKAEAAKQEILKQVPSADLEILELDVSSFDSIRAFAKEYKKRFSKLNLLINNAGILKRKKEVNEDGTEVQFATNHLGHFLLTSLLIGLIPDTADSRIVSLSSIAHKNGKIFFDDINCDNQSKWDTPYAQSKLACLMFSEELNRRLYSAGKQIRAVSAHPGGTDSGLFDSMPKSLMFILRLTFVPFFLHSTESAAKPVLMAALDKNITGGMYIGPTGLMEMKGPPGIAKQTDYSQDPDVARKLWELSEEMTGKKFKV